MINDPLSPGGIVVTGADETDDTRVTRGLRETAERWKRALEVNGVGVWDYNVAAHQVICSPKWREMLRVATSDNIRFPEFLVHPDDLPRFILDWNSLLQGSIETLDTAIRMRVAESYRFMKVRARVTERAAAGEALRVIGTHADIHDARQQQMQAASARKLEAIGQLAAGIAHEINTPMQYVGDNVHFLKGGFDALLACINQIQRLADVDAATAVSSADIQAILQSADNDYLQQEIPKAILQSLDGIKRISSIIGAMKEFSHPGQDRVPTDLNRAIANTIIVATAEWKYVARIETAFDERLSLVPVIAGEFNQAILNIIINAAHAIGEVAGASSSHMGTIRVTTTQLPDCAQISIEDDGCGMQPQVQERIFDPFFTTKPVGKGTGQGLAIAHNVIVSRHGGTIECQSKAGRGTTFVIRLPLKFQPVPEMAAA